MTQIMLEVPAGLKAMVPAIEKMFEVVDRQLRRAAAQAPASGYDQFERELRESVAQVERTAHGAALAALDVDAPRLRIDGVEHVRVGRHQTTFMAEAGEVPVTRSLYRCVGTRNGPTVCFASP